MGLLEEKLANGLLNQPATANPKMLAQALKARNQPRKQLTGQGLLDTAAIGLSPVPVIGDALGLAADASRFYNEPESRTPLNFGLAALGLIPFVPPLVSAGLGKFAQSQGKTLSAPSMTGPARNQAGAIVYHGSPHKFDQFDSSKIGTGEGAQAYGHGLYFAENPTTAETYKRALSIPEVDVNGARYKPPAGIDRQDPQRLAYSYLTGAVDSQSAEPFQMARRQIKSLVGDSGVPADAINILNEWEKKGAKVVNGGSLYKVDLPDEAIAKMLDWDAPLSKQPKEVREMFSTFPDTMKGGDAYAIMAARAKPGTDYGVAMRGGGGFSNASEQLKTLGIPGVKYLDGGSRSAGDGTRNFVVFPGNEGLLKILSKE